MSKLVALIFALLFALPAVAQSQGDLLGTCLADNTTGRDRKDLARWIFVAMAAHPDIRDLANASQEAADKTSRTMGALVTRLLTESYPKEVQAAARGEDSKAMRRAFEILGQLAMLELTSNADVAASVCGFERSMDRAKITAVLEGK
jgi:hypothetical protein